MKKKLAVKTTMPAIKSNPSLKGSTPSVTFTITLKNHTIPLNKAFVALQPITNLVSAEKFNSIRVEIDTHGANFLNEKIASETQIEKPARKRGRPPKNTTAPEPKKRGPKPGSKRGRKPKIA